MSASSTITQKDIARRLNVSRSCVAAVLSGGGPRVPVHTRQRVFDAAREMGYVPQAVGQMLRRGSTHRVAFAYWRQEHPILQSWYAPAIEEAAALLSEWGYTLEVRVCSERDAVIAEIEQIARSRSADAVVLWGHADDVANQASALEAIGFPFVAFGYHEAEHPNWTQVDFDHFGMMRSALSRLGELGRDRIAYIGFDGDASYARNLRAGFRTAANQTLGAGGKTWVLLHVETVETRNDVYRQVASWFDLPAAERPNGIAYRGGSVAQSIEQILLAHGTRLGDANDAISIVGLDGHYNLLCGQGWRFVDEPREGLVAQMIREQLIPMLTDGKPKVTVLRHLPQLHPTGAPLIDGALGRLKIETG